MRYFTRALMLTALMAAPVSAQPIATLTLLTYNVRGLPWPIASGRSAALSAIASRLTMLRRQGRQPHLVALQEAFMADAKTIGRLAGYRYEAFGPTQDDASAEPISADDRAFLRGASFMRGERSGKRVDSGLAIFSDYPIVATRDIAYPVCAGYDCLANKGALAVQVAVPGLAAPVTVIDTHLNARKASGVPQTRSTYAYRRQIDAFKTFVSAVAADGSPILVAGDFNVGNRPARSRYFSEQLLGDTPGLSAVERDCADAIGCEGVDVAESIRRGKDWLLYRRSQALTPTPTALTAPFGRTPGSVMLSDHVGIMVTYAFTPSAGPKTDTVRTASR